MNNLKELNVDQYRLEQYAIHDRDTCFLYNVLHKKFIDKGQLELLNTNQYNLTSVPNLTSDISNAGIFIIKSTLVTPDKILTLNSLLTFECISYYNSSSFYLGVEDNDTLQVSYIDANLPSAIWKPSSPYQNKTHLMLFYGVPYILENTYFGMTLNHSNGSSRLVISESKSDLEEKSEQWILIPTKPVYTCSHHVNLCAQTQGSRNAFNIFKCQFVNEKQQPNLDCKNQYGENVYMNDTSCKYNCGSDGTENNNNVNRNNIQNKQVQNLQKNSLFPGKFNFVFYLLPVLFLILCILILKQIIKK